MDDNCSNLYCSIGYTFQLPWCAGSFAKYNDVVDKANAFIMICEIIRKILKTNKKKIR